jgi:hypothetical protein
MTSKHAAIVALWLLLACTDRRATTDDEVGIDPVEACVSVCLKYQCDIEPPAEAEERCENSCEDLAEQTTAQGPDCTAAFDELLACRDALTCEEFLASLPFDGNAVDPCELEHDAFELACPGVPYS